MAVEVSDTSGRISMSNPERSPRGQIRRKFAPQQRTNHTEGKDLLPRGPQDFDADGQMDVAIIINCQARQEGVEYYISDFARKIAQGVQSRDLLVVDFAAHLHSLISTAVLEKSGPGGMQNR